MPPKKKAVSHAKFVSQARQPHVKYANGRSEPTPFSPSPLFYQHRVINNINHYNCSLVINAFCPSGLTSYSLPDLFWIHVRHCYVVPSNALFIVLFIHLLFIHLLFKLVPLWNVLCLRHRLALHMLPLHTLPSELYFRICQTNFNQSINQFFINQ